MAGPLALMFPGVGSVVTHSVAAGAGVVVGVAATVAAKNAIDAYTQRDFRFTNPGALNLHATREIGKLIDHFRAELSPDKLGAAGLSGGFTAQIHRLLPDNLDEVRTGAFRRVVREMVIAAVTEVGSAFGDTSDDELHGDASVDGILTALRLYQNRMSAYPSPDFTFRLVRQSGLDQLEYVEKELDEDRHPGVSDHRLLFFILFQTSLLAVMNEPDLMKQMAGLDRLVALVDSVVADPALTGSRSGHSADEGKQTRFSDVLRNTTRRQLLALKARVESDFNKEKLKYGLRLTGEGAKGFSRTLQDVLIGQLSQDAVIFEGLTEGNLRTVKRTLGRVYENKIRFIKTERPKFLAAQKAFDEVVAAAKAEGKDPRSDEACKRAIDQKNAVLRSIREGVAEIQVAATARSTAARITEQTWSEWSAGHSFREVVFAAVARPVTIPAIKAVQLNGAEAAASPEAILEAKLQKHLVMEIEQYLFFSSSEKDYAEFAKATSEMNFEEKLKFYLSYARTRNIAHAA